VRSGRLEGQELDGRFVMHERIDEGGMAYVYRATDRVTSELVAVKVLREGAAREPGIRRRFVEEAQLTMSLMSRHVVEVVAVGAGDEGPAYMAMELLEGARLDELCGDQLPFDQVYDVVRQIAAALEVAHARGVVHRDLKPENVFLVQEHGELVCKLIDFGVAKSDTGRALTATGVVIGTPHYMAPEQAAGRRRITPRTDVYALGIVLYELVAGELPFDGFDAMQVMLAQVGLPPPSLRERRPDCPEPLEAIISRCLAKNPEERYADAAELRAAIDAIAGDAPTAAEPTRQDAGSGVRLRIRSDGSELAETLVSRPDTAPEVLDRHTPTPMPWIEVAAVPPLEGEHPRVPRGPGPVAGWRRVVLCLATAAAVLLAALVATAI
jgi:serine/threonine-protein kinase